MDFVFFDSKKTGERQLVAVFTSADLAELKKTRAVDAVAVLLSKPDDALFSKAKSLGFWVVVKAVSPQVALWACQKKASALLVALDLEKPVIDLAIVTVARQNKVMVVFSLSDWFSKPALQWSKLFKHAFWIAKLCQKAKADSWVVSGALNEWQVRSAVNRSVFGAWLGLKEPKQSGLVSDANNRIEHLTINRVDDLSRDVRQALTELEALKVQVNPQDLAQKVREIDLAKSAIDSKMESAIAEVSQEIERQLDSEVKARLRELDQQIVVMQSKFDSKKLEKTLNQLEILKSEIENEFIRIKKMK